MTFGRILALLLLMSGAASGQDTIVVRGTVTYLSADAVYTSLGRDRGVKDSTRMTVLRGHDSIAVIQVFAVSSKSSVCHVLQSMRPVVAGDLVIARVTAPPAVSAPAVPVIRADSIAAATAPADSSPTRTIGREKFPFMFTGRIGLQYMRSTQSTGDVTLTQPGLVVSLKGVAADIPLKLDFYGNFRSFSYGKQLLMSSDRIDRTRIYRFSVEYDDTTNRIAAGRLIPPGAMSTGYVDGILFAHRFGRVGIGTSFGFEPDFNQQSVSSAMKKFSLFTTITGDRPWHYSADLSYTRRWDRGLPDREVVSGDCTITPGGDFFFTGQGDLDLLTPSDGSLHSDPRLTSLVVMTNTRVTPSLNIGAGVTAWRPVYPIRSVAGVPDSLLDHELHTSPTANLIVSLPSGLSWYNSYSPKTSGNGFGKEYLATSTLSSPRFADLPVFARGTFTRNATTWTTLTGYGGSLGYWLGPMSQITARYQFYHYVISQGGERYDSRSIAADAVFGWGMHMSFSGTIEHLTGLGSDGYSLFTELSYRF